MADGKVIIDTQLNSKGAESGITKLKKGLTGIGGVAKTGLGVATKAIGAAGAAVTAFGGYAVKAGANFEKSLSNVKALISTSSKDLTGDMDAIEKKAIEVNKRTKFSATEVADGFGYMAMAGYNAEQMLKSIDATTNLAILGNTDLATTTDIVTDAITAFGLTADDTAHFADTLAVAASTTNTDVYKMGETFKYVAPVVGALYDSAEDAERGMTDAAKAIGYMADGGIKASQAGTNLRAIITRLQTDAGASSKSLGALGILTEKLGVQFYDTEGKVRPLNDVISEARVAWQGLTKEEQANYAKKIAGQNAITGWNLLMNASADEINKVESAFVDVNGAAEDMANIVGDNLLGDVDKLKSAMEVLGINISKSGISDGLRKITQQAGALITDIASAIESGDRAKIQESLNDLVGFAVQTVVEAAPTIINAGVELIGVLANAMIDNTDTILSAAGEVVSNIGTKLSENVEPVISGLTNMLTSAINFLSANLPDMMAFALSLIEKIGSSIMEHAPELANSIGSLLTTVFNSIGDTLPILKPVTDLFALIAENIDKVTVVIAPLIAGIVAYQAALVAIKGIMAAVEVVQAALNATITLNPYALIVAAIVAVVAAFVLLWNKSEAFRSFWTNMWNKIVDVAQSVWSKISDVVQIAWKKIQEIWNKAVSFFSPIFKAIGEAGKAGFEMVRTIATTVFKAIEKIVKAVQPVFETVFSVIRTVASAVFSAIRTVATVAINAIVAVAKPIGTLVSTPFRLAWSLIQTVWNVAKAYFVGIFNGIRGIFSAISKIWHGDFSGAWSEIKGVFKNAGKTFLNIGKEIINGLVNGIKETAGKAVDAVKNVGSSIISGAKNILGVHSPSRVFKRLGEYTMQGFAVGLQSMNGKVVGMVQKTMSDVISEAEDAAERAKDRYESIVESYNKTVEAANANTKKYAELEKKAAKQKGKEREKTNKEMEKLEKEQTKLVEKAEKQRGKIKKAELAYQRKVAKAFYSDEAKDLLAYYDELNAQPSLVDNIKKQAEELEEQYKKIESDHKSALEKIGDGQKEALASIREEYKKDKEEVNKIAEEKLNELKKTYETKMSEIEQSQQKLYESTLNFTGLFDAVKTSETISADDILKNAADQTAQVEKYSQNLEKIKGMNLPDEIKQQFKDMGVEAADQLEIFVNMSEDQIAVFVEQWKKRNELSKKIANEWYDEQKTSLTNEFKSQQKILEDQHKQDLKRIEQEYKQKRENITKYFDQLFNTELKNYQRSMARLKDEAARQAGEIAAAIKAALSEGTAMTESEAQSIADNMTSGILTAVRDNLEIHSPSRVFANIADLCLQGFEKPFNNYNPVDLMKPSVNSVMNSVKTAGIQSQQTVTNNSTTNAPVLNFYDSAVSPDAVMRQFNKTMRYGLAGGLA